MCHKRQQNMLYGLIVKNRHQSLKFLTKLKNSTLGIIPSPVFLWPKFRCNPFQNYYISYQLYALYICPYFVFCVSLSFRFHETITSSQPWRPFPAKRSVSIPSTLILIWLYYSIRVGRLHQGYKIIISYDYYYSRERFAVTLC